MGIGIIKTLLFLFIFSTYLPVYLLKFWLGELVGCRIKFHIQWVPTRHTFDGPCYPKNKKCLKQWCHHHIFSGISCFGGSGVCQKYALWVLVGWGIKFCIQWALPLEIWVKTQGDMLKIWTKKVVIFMIPILKFILKNCLRGGPFWILKNFN